MSIPSVKTIETAFKKWLQPGGAQKVRKLMDGAGSNRSAEEALEAINKIIGASGVETIRGDNHGGFWQDAVLAYVNMGDPYVATVWYEPRYGMSGRWGVGGYGDWVEYWEREHGQLEGLSGKRGSYMRVPGKAGRGLAGLGSYSVFTRTWWKENPSWPNGLEPDASGKRHYLERGLATEEEARRVAKEYNATHRPGRLSKRAEFEED